MASIKDRTLDEQAAHADNLIGYSTVWELQQAKTEVKELVKVVSEVNIHKDVKSHPSPKKKMNCALIDATYCRHYWLRIVCVCVLGGGHHVSGINAIHKHPPAIYGFLSAQPSPINTKTVDASGLSRSRKDKLSTTN